MQGGNGGRILAIVLALVLLLLPAFVFATCKWPEPGALPYTGDKAAAVRKMMSIPADIREELALSVEQHTYSAQAEIRRDGLYVNGLKSKLWTGLTDMNFGADGRMCPGLVDVSMWPKDRAVGTLIHHRRGYSVAVISACGNVAGVVTTQAATAHAAVARGVPEPGSLTLAAAALLSLFVVRRAKTRGKSWTG